VRLPDLQFRACCRAADIGPPRFGNELLAAPGNIVFDRFGFAARGITQGLALARQVDGLDDPQLPFALAACAFARQFQLGIVERADDRYPGCRLGEIGIVARGNTFTRQRSADREIFGQGFLRGKRQGC